MAELTHDEQRAKVADLAKESRFTMLTTTDTDGHLVSRPMARQDVDLDSDVWFIAARSSRKVEHIRANPTVGLTITSSTSWLSLSGTAEVVDDTEKLAELWSSFTEAWLPGGPENPDAILIHVDVDTAQYWDEPGGRVASLISLVSAKATGKPYEAGSSDIVTDL